jgi:hypothetical protein
MCPTQCPAGLSVVKVGACDTNECRPGECCEVTPVDDVVGASASPDVIDTTPPTPPSSPTGSPPTGPESVPDPKTEEEEEKGKEKEEEKPVVWCSSHTCAAANRLVITADLTVCGADGCVDAMCCKNAPPLGSTLQTSYCKSLDCADFEDSLRTDKAPAAIICFSELVGNEKALQTSSNDDNGGCSPELCCADAFANARKVSEDAFRANLMASNEGGGMSMIFVIGGAGLVALALFVACAFFTRKKRSRGRMEQKCASLAVRRMSMGGGRRSSVAIAGDGRVLDDMQRRMSTNGYADASDRQAQKVEDADDEARREMAAARRAKRRARKKRKNSTSQSQSSNYSETENSDTSVSGYSDDSDGGEQVEMTASPLHALMAMQNSTSASFGGPPPMPPQGGSMQPPSRGPPPMPPQGGSISSMQPPPMSPHGSIMQPPPMPPSFQTNNIPHAISFAEPAIPFAEPVSMGDDMSGAWAAEPASGSPPPMAPPIPGSASFTSSWAPPPGGPPSFATPM